MESVGGERGGGWFIKCYWVVKLGVGWCVKSQWVVGDLQGDRRGGCVLVGHLNAGGVAKRRDRPTSGRKEEQ